MALEADRRLAGTFNFEVSLRRSASAQAGESTGPVAATQGAALCDGGFQECSGLEIEMDVQELQEGGRNDGVIRRVGRGRYSPLVLKRGMVYGAGQGVNPAFWEWIQGVLAGELPVPRYDGTVKALAADGHTVLAVWSFDRALPQKVSGPALNAKTGDVAIEELHLAHEGLRLAL